MADTSSKHIPVLADEVEEWLRPQAGQILIDGTLGGGGHARRLAGRVGTGGLIIAVDLDPAAVRRAQCELADLPVRPLHASYADIPEVLRDVEIPAVDGILLDLGLSSDQLADSDRGFSFNVDAPLDLRFNPDAGEPAWRLLNRLSAPRLADLIYQYGEERHSRRIARAVVEA